MADSEGGAGRSHAQTYLGVHYGLIEGVYGYPSNPESETWHVSYDTARHDILQKLYSICLN